MGEPSSSCADDGRSSLLESTFASASSLTTGAWRWASHAKQATVGYLRTAQIRVVEGGRTPDDVVVVAGSTRSGTTWLAELLDHDGAYRLCFEPLEWHHRSSTFEHFHRLQYIRPGSDDERLIGPLEQMLDGRIRTPYTDRWDPHPSWRPRSKLMLKCVRSNLLIGAIAERRPEVPIVHIVRHPLAVIASRSSLQQSDWAADVEDLDDLLAQPDLVEDFLRPHMRVIRAATDPFARQLVMWCIEQAVPLATAGPSTICVRYESLVEDPVGMLPSVFEHVGAALPDDLERATSRPSQTSWNGTGFASSPRDHTSSWRSKFDRVQIRQADRMIDRFGLRDLVDDDATVIDLRPMSPARRATT